MDAGIELAEDTSAGARGGAVGRVVGAALEPYGVLRGNRDLALLFGGQVVSSFGDWLYIIALIALAYTLTGSATLVAALTFARLLPYAVFLPLTGALADRFNPKAMMIAADLGRCLCMLGLLFVTSRATIPLAFPLVFVSTCLFSLFRPAFAATLPSVVGDEEKLIRANALKSQVDGLALTLGPALGGVLVLAGATRAAFALNAATYLVSATTLLLVRVPPRERATRPAEEGWLAQTTAGYRFLFRENEGVLAAATLVAAGVTLFTGAYWTLSVVLAVQAFHLGVQGAGFLNAADGAGSLAAGFLIGPLARRVRVGTGFIVSTAGVAVCIALIGLSPAAAPALLALALLGVCGVCAQVFSTTLLQTGTPRELLGRVFGAFESTYIFTMLLGALIAGPLIARFGPRATSVGLALVALLALAAALPRLCRLEGALGVRVFLRRVPVLDPLTRASVDDLARRMRLERAAAGTPIVRQGAQGDTLYIIKGGEVDVTARGAGGQDTHLATLGPTDYFGEIALLRDVPRTATVTARGPVELYTLSRADFQDLLARAEEVRASLGSTGDARLLDTQTRLSPRL